MKKSMLLPFVIMTFALQLAACGSQTGSSSGATPTPALATIIAEGHLVPYRNLYLSFLARGRVSEILVQRGEHVTQGQVLMSLGDRQPADAALTGAQLELVADQLNYDTTVRTADLGRAQAWQAYMDAQKKRATAQLAWERLDLNAIKTEIDNAQAIVTARKVNLDNAQEDFDKYGDLAEDNPTRKSYENALRQAQTNYNAAVRKVEDLTNKRDSVRAALDAALAAEAETKRTYENTQDGADTDKLALAQARLDNAKAQVAAAQSALDDYDLKAPFNGTVMDVNVSADQMVGPETWAVALADTSQWYVDTSDLTELDVIEIGVGQTVTVTADALPGVTMTGTVEEISAAPKVQGGDILYTVHIRLDNVDTHLRWGMTVEVIFNANE